MKRICLCWLFVLLLLCSCTLPKKNSEKTAVSTMTSSGVWLSFSEINTMLKSAKGIQAEFDEVIENCRSLKIQNLYIHVRSYCDSLFKSAYFPMIEAMEGIDFDVFAYMIERCHHAGIKVHAWINPYRVSTALTDVNQLRHDSPAYQWRFDEKPDNDKNVITYGGIYLNPAEYEVRELVINGIREILEKYKVDGIHFDDYFYPTVDEEFDKESYCIYQASSQNPLSLEDWRRSNVNALISGCYTAVKFYSKQILFTVSPMASIETNYQNLYADVKSWVQNGCIDAIIPQLYFGYEYPDENYRFDILLQQWKKLAAENGEVQLIIGLAPYKIGTESENDREEWSTKDDLIARQAEECYRDTSISGYILFSYTSLFSQAKSNVKQRENLNKVVQSYS